MAHLVYLLLSVHVAGKVICQEEPIIARGHVIHIVHQALEILSITKGAISDSAHTEPEVRKTSGGHGLPLGLQESCRSNMLSWPRCML